MKHVGYVQLLLAVAFLAAFTPLLALAQATGPTYKGFDLTPLIAGVITLLGGLLAWVSRKVAAAQTASAEKSRGELALLRVAAIAMAMAGDLWNELAREFQVRVADGSIGPGDREAFRQIVAAKIEEYTSADELAKLAAALGLPLPGLIAKVAEFIIDRVTKAHDVTIQDVSAKAFPVDPAQGFTDAG
jgi:hypothetical protein